MELKDFVKLNPKEVRRDKGLMQLYVKFYEAAFFVIPNCIGCSFKSGFKKLSKYANNSIKTINLVEKTKKMETKTFILKNQFKLKILSYKKNGITHRRYGYGVDENFAKELVKAGRSDVFSKLPDGKAKGSNEVVEKVDEVVSDVVESKETNYDAMDYRTELKPLYNEIRDRTGKSANGKSKNDIIEFLKENGY